MARMRRTAISVLSSALLISCGPGSDSEAVPDAGAESAATATRAIQIISSFPETGSSSRTARIIAPEIEAYFGRAVEIHYNPGGRGGDIGARMAANASPEDLTLFIGTVGNISLLPNILAEYDVDPSQDFRAVTQLTVTPDVLVVYAGLGVTSLDELVAHATERAEPLSYSHIAPFSIHRIEFLELLDVLGIAAHNDPSVRGSAAAMEAVASGVIELAITTAPYVAPLVKAGSVLPLVVANDSRLPMYPEVPTMTESGIAIPHGSWAGAFVPAATSDEDTERMFRAIEAALNDPDVIGQLGELGMIAAPSASPAAFAAYMAEERVRLGQVAEFFDVREN